MTTHILVLCTHNSARSVLGEGMLNHLARQRGRDIVAHSAGSAPSGRVNPHALRALERAGVDTRGITSKSWDVYSAPGAPAMRAVITVCDAAAAEPCPWWPGSPVRVHWGYPDPSAAPEAGREAAFELTRQAIAYRMLQLVELPFETLDDAQLRAAMERVACS